MSRIIVNPTNVSGAAHATPDTKVELLEDETEERAYLYVENPATNANTDIITVWEGEDESEKGLITLSVGEYKEWKIDPLTGLNDVPQGRIALSSDTTVSPFFARHAREADLYFSHKQTAIVKEKLSKYGTVNNYLYLT